MALRITLFPEVAIALNEEVTYHPVLMQRLREVGGTAPLEEKIAAIATYADILVDGEFQEKDLQHLFDTLLQKLRKMRLITIH